LNLTLTSDSPANRRFILLSPPDVPLGGVFQRVEGDAGWRQELLAGMQRLRGRLYLKDGAISERDLTPDGRHFQAIDEKAWHLLVLTPQDRVVGCMRYLQHHASTSFNRLRLRKAALARSEQWSEPLRRAVESEMETARRSGFSYVEFGGWAMDESVRGSSDALRSALFSYAWSELIGGCLGISMATHRNGSASILRRIGGRPLEWAGQSLPPYYDEQYKCDMEVIRFDSRAPSAKYQHAIDKIKSQIPAMPVICADKPSSTWHTFVNRWQNSTVALVPWTAEGVSPLA
jgi:hypothetical protein